MAAPAPPPAAAALSTSGVRASQVSVSAHALGRGSFGSVFRGSFSGCPVAVKVCPISSTPPSANARAAAVQFRRESARYQCLRHPCIVQFFCVVADSHNLLLVTELMKGGSLFSALNALSNAGFRRLPAENVLRVAQHVTHGLAYLHATSFSFGDLKTLNVLLSAAPDLQAGTLPASTQAKLCDFGLSRNLKHLVARNDTTPRPDETQIPARHGPAGTFAYLAPEAFGGLPTDDADAPKRADVYALAVVLWELATLSRPWPGLKPLQLIGLVGREGRRPQWPADVSYLPRGYVQLVERCWKQDPAERPAVDEVARELERMYAALPGREESAWSFCKFRDNAKDGISEATEETVTEETVDEEGTLSDDWDVVHVDEEEEFSEEDLRERGWSWAEDTQHTVMSTITGESQRSSSNSRTSVRSEEQVPELEIKRVISYMLPPGWQEAQEQEVDDEELDKPLLDTPKISEKSNRGESALRRQCRKSAYRRIKERERPRTYAVPSYPEDEEVEQALAELATMDKELQRGLVSSNTTIQSGESESLSRGNSKQVGDIMRTYSLPESLADGNGDIDRMLRMLEAEEVLDINSFGVSMYTRPHFR